MRTKARRQTKGKRQRASYNLFFVNQHEILSAHFALNYIQIPSLTTSLQDSASSITSNQTSNESLPQILDPKLLKIRQHNFGGASAEIATIWGLWFKKRINGKLAMRSSAICLRACHVTIHSFTGFAPNHDDDDDSIDIENQEPGYVFLESVPLSPFKSLEIAIGAILCGVDWELAMKKGMDSYFERNQESQTRKVVLQRAMIHFLHDDRYEIGDKNKFNDALLRRIYLKLSALQHPDVRDGDHTQWLRLSAYYGILSAICEALHGGKFGFGIGGNSATERYCADRSKVVAAVIKKSKSKKRKVLCSQSIYR